ncbi:FAS1-like dehydratase domain-containing protein [Trinickia violacea]|nr:MaoC family dehydratase N-terminal domain-containing protein [Trinickia violacea]
MDDSTRKRTGPATGTYEQGKAMLGQRSPVNFGTHPVSEVRIAQFCTVIEDGNLSYWNAAASARLWGRPVAPPAMLQSWTLPLPWLPDREVGPDFMLMKLPLPGSSIINVSTETVYHRPVYIGETLNFWDVATELSEQKETRLGIGHFVTTVATYQSEAGETVATCTNVQFRFEPRSA